MLKVSCFVALLAAVSAGLVPPYGPHILHRPVFGHAHSSVQVVKYDAQGHELPYGHGHGHIVPHGHHHSPSYMFQWKVAEHDSNKAEYEHRDIHMNQNKYNYDISHPTHHHHYPHH